MLRYQVVVEDRTFEIDIGPEGRVWVDRRPLNVDLKDMEGWPGYSLLVDNRSYEAHVEVEGEQECRVVVAGRSYLACLLTEQHTLSKTTPTPTTGKLAEVAPPLPGLLVEVRVTEGQAVKEGDVVAVLESMKMHLELRAPRSGIVRNLATGAGREVVPGEVLAVIERI